MDNLELNIRNAVRAVIIRDGRILLLRKEYEDGSEQFALPGGGQDTGETPVQRPSGILDNPLDFSSEPVLPKIDAPSELEIRKSMQRGVEYLLRDQNPNGSWGSATRTKGLNIYAPVPGAHHAFRAATTSLCISALIEIDSNDSKDPRVAKSIDRGETWHSLSKTLPTTPVYDMDVHAEAEDLIAGTHGRSVFVLDTKKIKEIKKGK